MAGKLANPKAASRGQAKPPARPNAKPAAVKVEPADAEAAADAKAPGIKLKDLIDRVVESSGVKRKDAKPAIEAFLTELDTALASGESISLARLGKLRVVRTAADGAGAMTLRLRKPTPGEGNGKTGKEGLAAESE